MQPVISVVIPAHNAELSLQRCVESALSQEGVAAEVIVIDDGSTDNTAAVAIEFGDRITFAGQVNQGQGAARNHGLRLAKGEMLAFLDADDYWKPGFLQVCQTFLQTHRDAVAVNTGFTIVFRDGTQTDFPQLEPYDRVSDGGWILEDFFRFWAKHDHVRTGTCLMRTDVVREIGGQCEDLRISQDLEFWGMLATYGPWGFIPQSYWVGDSRVVGAKSGWKKKYAMRRKLCPTVEQWSQRLGSRVPLESREAFEVVRGRVAAGYMHAKIIGGDHDGARHILETYGDSLPSTSVTKLLRSLSKLGWPGWKIGTTLVSLRESLK